MGESIMTKYKFTFVSSRKLRTDDSLENHRTIEAENIEIAISKFFTLQTIHISSDIQAN